MKTILVVEDSRFIRLTTERTLARAGYQVMTACDGEEALKVAAEIAPDLVLLDMLLPKLSGPEVLRTLRTTPQTAGVPIVVLSSLPQSNERKLKRDGATAYFDKSSLRLHDYSDTLIHVVKKMLDGTSDDGTDIEGPDSDSPLAAKGKV